MIVKLIAFFYLFLSPFLYAHSTKKKALKSHEHGAGILNIAQSDNELFFEFEIPGNDIVGFEYEAVNEEDIQKVKDALNLFSDYKNIILPSSTAKCDLIDYSSEIVNEGSHSEFLIGYKFNCEKISALKIIYLKYFKLFPNCKKTNIKIFGRNKQSSYVINNAKKIINVKDHF